MSHISVTGGWSQPEGQKNTEQTVLFLSFWSVNEIDENMLCFSSCHLIGPELTIWLLPLGHSWVSVVFYCLSLSFLLGPSFRYFTPDSIQKLASSRSSSPS